MALATKMSSERTPRNRHSLPEHAFSSVRATSRVWLSHSAQLMQRKASCACGGGCPRCREQHTLQSKLQINTPGDVFEREADRVAEAVVSGSSAGGVHVQSHVGLQRRCACGGAAGAGTCACQDKEREESLQMSPENSGGSAQEFAPPIVHAVLGSPGRPLDPATRAFFEPRLGRDFSDVRVHTNTQAAESARAIDALAYTVGRHVVFGSGQFAPGTTAGDRVLAHELTHVIQQSNHRAERLQRQVSPPSSHLQSPRFSPSAKLERCFEDTDRLGQGDPDTDAVKRIQQALIDVQAITGNTYDLGSSGPNKDGVDGDYGRKTAAAVRKFKADENLGFTEFGDVGPGTMHHLDELFSAAPAEPIPPEFEVPPIIPEPIEGRCKLPTNPDLSGSNFNPTTMGQARACLSVHSTVCRAVEDDAAEANKQADRSGLPGTPFGPRDAFRHSLWNCLMTQDSRIGLDLAQRSEIAERFATAHENDARGKASPLDIAMDLHDNATGRKLGALGEDCVAECRRALEQGELRTLRGLEADDVARREKLPPASPTVVPTCLGASDQPWP